MRRRFWLWSGAALLMALAFAGACKQAVPTPEGPSIIGTVQAMLPKTPVPITPQPTLPPVSALIATVRASMPTPSTAPTPEGPSIVATIERMITVVTPTPTPSPTRTPGPTVTPYALQNANIAIPVGTSKFIPIKLSQGERVEGYVSTSGDIAFTLSIQDPTGKAIQDFPNILGSNFKLVAPGPGSYSLLIKVPGRTCPTPCPALPLTYVYDIFGN